MHSFFISPTAFDRQPVTLTGDQAHQVRRVLRMRLGDRATLLDGRGGACEGILIAVGDADVKFQVVRRWEAEREPRTHVTLYQAVLKGERFGWALQKGTEVGVSAFTPMICERNVVDELDAVESKRERWERIIQEAAEQCGRGRLPELGIAQLFGQAVALPGYPPSIPPAAAGGKVWEAPPCRSEWKVWEAPPCGSGGKVWEAPPCGSGGDGGGVLRLIPWEGEHVMTLRHALAGCNFAAGLRIQVYVGPEGGFTEAEIAQARRYGVQPITLGPRILRAETAGVIAAALILYEAGEM